MSASATPVYRKRSASTAKSFRKASMERELADWTEAIGAADSHEAKIKLLAQKQEAQQALHPPRRSPEKAKEAQQALHPPRRSPEKAKKAQQAEPDQIKDPGLRAIYENSEAAEGLREARQAEPVKKAARAGYANGLSLAATVNAICMRPDISSRGKAVAMALASHHPTIRPTIERLQRLTGFAKNTVSKGLSELNSLDLLTWKRGKSRVANQYNCLWLSRLKNGS